MQEDFGLAFSFWFRGGGGGIGGGGGVVVDGVGAGEVGVDEFEGEGGDFGVGWGVSWGMR